MSVRSASFAFRVVRRKSGMAAIIYRRSLKTNGTERLTRVAALGPLAYSAGTSLLRSAVQLPGQTRLGKLEPGPFYPLDPDGGARVACYALVARGLRNPTGLHHAAENLKRADGTEAAWWFGLMNGAKGLRAVRALRILLEAVK
ncbi:MAG: hypothetical protein ABSB22_10630 [Thermodesulfobacteriota bacterium]|jgi:hypothetical protein